MMLEKLRDKAFFQNTIDVWIAYCEERKIDWYSVEGYRNFINHYPEIRKRSPEAGAFDLRLDDRITAKGKD